MGSECGESSCSTSSGSCESSCEESCPACQGDCGADPVECASGMWKAAFFEAMKQVQVEIIKTKLQKAWGPKMEKAADAVIEAMGVKWQTMMAEAKAKDDLRSKLAQIWQEGK